MHERRPNARQRTLVPVLLAVLAGALLAPAAAPGEVLRQIPYSYTTKLALSTRPRTFRFSLIGEDGVTVVWSEQKAYTLATSRVLRHMLGSVTPLPEAEFSQQLKVRLQYKATATNWPILATTPLQIVPYAMWSATSEAPGPQGPEGPEGPAGPAGATGPAGPACWDLNDNGACDPAEDVVGANGCDVQDCRGANGANGADGANGVACWDLDYDGICDPMEDVVGADGCNVQDCRGAKGDPGDLLAFSCTDGQTIVWDGTLGAWACGGGQAGECTDYFLDADEDGSGTGSPQCLWGEPPAGSLFTALDADDADDGNCLVNPDMVWFLNSRGTTAPEWCGNGRDDDMDGAVDNACDIYFQSLGGGGTTVTGWFDRDGDGFFTQAAETLPVWFGGCLAGATPTPASPPGTTRDCDNLDATIHPGAADACDGIDQDCSGADGIPEVCGNAVDDDCDGQTDEAGCL